MKIGDFGLARGVGVQQRGEEEEVVNMSMNMGMDVGMNMDVNVNTNTNTNTNTAGVGTYLYASPEQLQGKHYDRSTDVFSLGVMLFELCFPMYTVRICLCVVLCCDIWCLMYNVCFDIL